jgi:hypothetical protein
MGKEKPKIIVTVQGFKVLLKTRLPRRPGVWAGDS